MARVDDRRIETQPLSPAAPLKPASSVTPPMALLLYHRDGAEVVPLEPDAPVVIGREAPADVVIPDRNLSRRHARFVFAGGSVSVEDLGSTNGTRVRGQLVERASLRVGEPVALGAVVALAQACSPLEPELSGLDGHERFCDALEQAVVEARYFGDQLAVMMLSAAGDSGEPLHVSRWSQSARALLRPVDRVALYGPHILEVLLPRTPAAAALALAERIVKDRRAAPATLCGLATFPESATAAERLIESTRLALQKAFPEAPLQRCPHEGSYTLVTEARPAARPEQPIATSAAMVRLFESVERVARSTIPVLIHGETGAGKEVIARAIHERGRRRDKPLVCVNCGAIPAQLVESTLFGHVRGAFTGADASRKGVFGSADGGTVLLDEIGELPPGAQAALLRVLEAGKMTRVGAPEEVEVDVRVLAATHRDLDAMCDEGRFRRDLLYRLNAVMLGIPPLRERAEEIPALAARFLAAANRANGRALAGISPEAVMRMQRYRWPGNLRELRNAIERAVVIAQGDRIELDDLPQRVVQAVAGSDSPEPPVSGEDDRDLRARVRCYERQLIVQALRAEGGNQTQCARVLKIPLRTLVHKISKLGITRDDYA